MIEILNFNKNYLRCDSCLKDNILNAIKVIKIGYDCQQSNISIMLCNDCLIDLIKKIKD